jgi:hypothetical protein
MASKVRDGVLKVRVPDDLGDERWSFDILKM